MYIQVKRQVTVNKDKNKFEIALKQGCQMIYLKPKISICVNVGELDDVGIFYGHFVYFMYGHLVYFVTIWYIL
jgi:hypothetical protein